MSTPYYGKGNKYDSLNQRKLDRMNENREKKQQKEQRAQGDTPFSTEAGKDYYLELVAAEETLNKLREKYVALEKEFNEYRQRERERRERYSYGSVQSIEVPWPTWRNNPLGGAGNSSSSGD